MELQQVRLQKLGCYASEYRWPHDPHIWHILRTARKTLTTPKPGDQPFYSYFWCDGVMVQQ